MTNTTETLASEATLESSTLAEVKTLAQRIADLRTLDMDEKQTIKSLTEKVNELVMIVMNLSATAPVASVSRNRGPASEKVMDENDARRVMLGDLKGDSHKEAAEKLGLSYGQIYSARKGFTFKPVYKEMIDAIKAEQAKQE